MDPSTMPEDQENQEDREDRGQNMPNPSWDLPDRG